MIEIKPVFRELYVKNIYIIGHKHPDTDSICSCIGYSAFLNASGKETYIPARCGELNAETKFALARFGVESPSLVVDLEPSVSDLPSLHTEYATARTPTFDVIDKMDKNNLRNLPITDENGKLIGLVSEHGLARAFMLNRKMEALSISPVHVETLARILSGRIIVHGPEILEGSVYISIDALHVILSRITSKDIAIVGDDEPTQIALLSAGIAALIIADSAPVGDRVIKLGNEKGVCIISTDIDAFGVANMIHLTLPAENLMTTDMAIVHGTDSMEVVKQLVLNSKYRAACVVDKNGKFLGSISRNTLLNDIAKSVILLDHNEYSQAVKGVESADIVEIVDHHRLGAMSTLQPIRFDLEPLGSTCTIIAKRFMDAGIQPEKSIAGVLLSGILSDTLGLRMSTTTGTDKTVAAYLAEIAEVDPVKYAEELIFEGMSLTGVSQSELLERDTKEFNLCSRRIVIAQVLIPSFEYAYNNSEAIYTALHEKLTGANAPDVYISLYTSVNDMGSVMFAAGDAKLSAAMHWDKPMLLSGVVSRKKDFVPAFGKILESVS
ncbi:MAG TPA: putative manganese-dependent inorganic diphosphatase [Methanocorpusculum sp.]|nr:putative manganese-dependent inorganic diphosphatase [Methanocorpusculum sp.]